MTGRTVNSALVLLVLGNFFAVISDIFIKVMGSDAPIFQFIFLRGLLTVACLLPFCARFEPGLLAVGLGVHAIRAHMHLLGLVCMVIALTSVPLATANALFYAAPVIIMVLGVLAYGEKLTLLNAAAIVSGFAGVVVILRPETWSWAALAALGAAVSLAINAVLVRRLPARQPMLHKLLLMYLMGLPVAAVLAFREGADWDPAVMVSAAGSAVFILGYNITVLLAYRTVAAVQVTSAEYTGLIWAIAAGWIGFGEAPDSWFFIGSALIVVPLALLGLRHRRGAVDAAT